LFHGTAAAAAGTVFTINHKKKKLVTVPVDFE